MEKSMQNKELKKKYEVLLKCPFCGGEAHIEEHKFWDEKAKGFTVQTYGVVCDNCCSMSWQHHRRKEKAIEQWNTRKPMERIIERSEEEADEWRDTQKKDWDNGYNNRFALGMVMGLDTAIEIVKEEGGIE